MKSDSMLGLRVLAIAGALLLVACAPKGEELYARAAAAMEQGNVNAAIIDLKNLLQAEPQNAKARALLGRALIASGDIGLGEVEIQKAKDLGVSPDLLLVSNCRVLLARKEFEEALAQCKPDAGTAEQQFELRVAHGNALLGLGRADEARTDLKAAVASRPASLEALLGLANATAAAEGLKAGIGVFDGAPEKMKLQARYWIALGTLNVQAADFPAAEKAYQAALDRADAEREPGERMLALGGLAEAQMRAGNVAAADATSAQLLELAPKHPLAKQLRGQVAAAGGKFDEARTVLEEVVVEQPENMDARLMLAYVNLQQGNLDQAEMHVQHVVARNPANAQAQKLLAEVRARQETPAESLASIQTALEQTSNDPTMLAVAGRMSLASGDRDQALAYLAQASKPGTQLTAQAQLEVANGYLMAGETDKALEILRAMPDSSALTYQRDSMLLLTLLRKGDEAQLIEQSKAMLARSGKDPVVRNLVGSVYAAAGKMDMAREQFKEALRLAPADEQSLINSAKLEIAQDKPAAAEPYLKKVLEKDPKNLTATMAMAVVAGARKDKKSVETYLVKAKGDHPDSVAAQAALAQFYLAEKDTAKAKSVMDAAVAANPASASMANARGVVMVGAKDFAAGIASFEEAVRIEPKSAEYAMNLARAKTISGDTKGALAVIDELLRQQPKSLPALHLAAATSMRGRDLERATGYVERVRQVAPDSPISHQLEGDLALAQKRYREALAAYEKADPSLQNRNVTMARFVAAKAAGASRPEKVVEDWIAKHPDDADAISIVAEAKRDSGDRAGAALLYEQAIAKAPGSAVLHNNLAMVYLDLGDPRALATAEKAYQLIPKAPPIQDTYGWALFKTGKAETAIEYLESAAKGMPDNAEIQYHLAAALAASGRKSEALPPARKAVAGTLPPAVRVEATKLLAELQ